MRRLVFSLLYLCCFALLASCEKQEDHGAIGGDLTTLKIGVESCDLETRASLLSGCEAAGSGMCLFAYDGTSGDLLLCKAFSQAEISGGKTVSIQMKPSSNVNFYLLGNFVFLRSGTPYDLITVYGEAAFANEASIRNLSYSMDGGAVSGGYTRLTFAQVASYGLPYSASMEAVNVRSLASGSALSFSAKRLFSKIRLSVDCSSLTGGQTDYFTSPKVYLRQANKTMRPFSQMRATSPAEVGDCDYDITAASANTLSYTLYVPENIHGVLLSTNTDNMNKIPAALAAAGVLSSTISSITYIEFSGVVNAAGMYGGSVSYRFYPGDNATRDFSLRRNNMYDITLSFSASTLLDGSAPDWKVSGALTPVGGSRFCLTSDAAFSNALPNHQDVVIRANRPAQVYLYYNASGNLASTNGLIGKEVVDPGHSISSLSDCGWTSDFLSSSNAPGDVPRRSSLTAAGISVSYNKSSGLLTFSVSDVGKFNAAIGSSQTLSIRFIPNEGSSQVISLNLLLYPNISVSWDKPLNVDFYPGMRRTATIVGLYGKAQYKRSDEWTMRRAKGDHSLTIKNAYSEAQSLPGQGGAYSGPRVLDIYSYEASMTGLGVMSPFTIRSSDAFNDGAFDSTVNSRVLEPHMSTSLGGSISLDVAGNEIPFTISVKDESGSSDIPLSSFDYDLFLSLYFPVIDLSKLRDYVTITRTGDYSFKIYRHCFGLPDPDYFGWKATPLSYEHRLCHLAFIPIDVPHNGTLTHQLYSDMVQIDLLPFTNISSITGLASSYQDWTLYDSSHFSAAYKPFGVQTLMSGARIYLPSSSFEIYSSPTNPCSNDYNTKSKSFVFGHTQTAANTYTIKMHIVDREVTNRATLAVGSTPVNHSAGPHKVYIETRNKWSGESKRFEIGSSSVYINVLMAGSFYFSDEYNYHSGYDFEGAGYMSAVLMGSTHKYLSSYVGNGRRDIAVNHSMAVAPIAHPVYYNGYTDDVIQCYGMLDKYRYSTMHYGTATDQNSHDEVSNAAYIIDFRPNGSGDADAAFLEEHYPQNYPANFYFRDNLTTTFLDVDSGFRDASSQGYIKLLRLQDVCPQSYGWYQVYEYL